MSGRWTEDDYDVARRLWVEGSTSTQILAALGRRYSRSAILGLMSRNRADFPLRGGATPSKPRAPSKAHSPEKPCVAPALKAKPVKSEAALAPRARRFDTKPDIARKAMPAPPQPDASLAVAFCDLDGPRCRFPINLESEEGSQMMVCGAPVVDATKPLGLSKSYCAYHVHKSTDKRHWLRSVGVVK